jgi:Fe-Mn family superoxide dismutase
MKTRRAFLKSSTILAGSLAWFSVRGKSSFLQNNLSPVFALPELGYAYDALEPHIDAATMQIHHSKHHQAYVDNLNKAIAAAKIENITLNDLMKNVSSYPVAIRNNGGGHYNHSLFWKLMQPGGSKNPEGPLAAAINQTFGSFENFKNTFSDAAKSVFGSGWAWLIKTADGKLAITTTPNQDNPLMDVAATKGWPIIALDVWEHAYYLHYQNKRVDYITAWWNVVNWNVAQQQFLSAQ